MSDRDTVNDVTAALIKDASNGPGSYVRRFAAAAPAKPGKLTNAQQAALVKYDGALPATPSADHCHRTGQFRGWVCRRCNTGLGYVEQEGWLVQARDYLRARR